MIGASNWTAGSIDITQSRLISLSTFEVYKKSAILNFSIEICYEKFPLGTQKYDFESKVLIM